LFFVGLFRVKENFVLTIARKFLFIRELLLFFFGVGPFRKEGVVESELMMEFMMGEICFFAMVA